MSGKIATLTQLDVNDYPEGIHLLHIRAKDELGHYSSVHTQTFYIQRSSLDGNLIAAYRFFYNNGFDEQEFVTLDEPVNPFELKMKLVLPDSLALGQKHTFHIQFKDLLGNWSVMQTDTFKIVQHFSENEFLALKEFYEATNGGEWLNTQAGEAIWDTTSIATVNDWKGVLIKDGRVTGIELPSNNLTGNIPVSFVSNLPDFRILRVDSNSIRSIELLPKEINLNIRAQQYDEGVLGKSASDNNVDLYNLGTYRHSSGDFTANNRFDANINDVYKQGINSANGMLAIPESLMLSAEEGDVLTLVQSEGDAVGSVYRFTIQNDMLTSILEENDQNLSGIFAYPNPFNEFVFINAQNLSGRTEVELFDLQGRKILSKTIDPSGSSFVKIDIPAVVNRGVYVLQIKSNGDDYKVKLMKK